ncbi:MAG: pectate lyase [Paludibacteraceae bacterium]|nr:pectate lyase [Paludibacteraceae bacterium]
MKKQIVFLLAFCMSVTAQADLQITRSGGWLESAFVEWTADAGEDNFKVVVVPASGGSMWEIDRALIRSYGSYYRADALGLPAGEYELLVFPVYPAQEGVEGEPEPVFSGRLTVRAHDRNGFAHFNYPDGVGAYRNDGRLKDGATVLYVHAGNAKTIEMDVTVDKKGGQRHCVGLQHILTAYEKGFANMPLDIRILGTIEANQLDSFGSKEEGLQIKGKVGVPMHITLEGVGDDAVIRGFGVLARQAESLELRNFAVMSALDDCISLDTKNNHVWVHHLDGFYSQPGSAADQKKGDGTIDVKTDSKYVTVSYNHFWDSGKSAMCGMKSETGPNYITYHHNWFDHSDSRHPRIRTMSVHVYNNYFDGNAKYCVGVTTGSSAFVENNYFRNCPRPMLSSMQGTDTKNGTDEKDAPTFSKEDGGIIKAYNNVFSGAKTLVYYSATNPVQFDAYLASSRSEQVPAEVKTKQGGTGYNNFDTDASLMPVITPDAPDSVPAIVRSEFGAGRMYHSDIDFSLANADDSSSDINQQLVSLIAGYESSLVAILGEDYVKPQAIDCPSVDADLRFDGRALLNPQGKVLRIYTLSGASLGTTTDTYIPIDALPTGHYIAVSPDGAIKW